MGTAPRRSAALQARVVRLFAPLRDKVTSSAQSLVPPLRPPPLADRPRVLFSLRPGELIQGFLVQEPNLSQVSLCFFNVVSYGVQLSLECNLASTIQRSSKALDAKCSTSGKGISLL